MNDSWSLPHIDEQKCKGCGCCVEACSEGALTLADGHAELTYPEGCGGCAECEEACPEGAIDCAFEIVWEELDEPTLSVQESEGGNRA